MHDSKYIIGPKILADKDLQFKIEWDFRKSLFFKSRSQNQSAKIGIKMHEIPRSQSRKLSSTKILQKLNEWSINKQSNN